MFQVLHYTETSAVDYNTRAESLAMFQALGAIYNFTVVNDNTGDEFNSLANLQQYAVVIFSNTSGDAILTPAQRANFEAYMNGGGSFMGIHSAAETYRHSSADGAMTGTWDWFPETVLGVSAQELPAKASIPPVSGTLNQAPIAQAYFIGVPNPWTKTDEYYYWENGYINTGFLTVLEVDATGPESYAGTRMAAHISELPMGGRSFYTTLGHSPADFTSDVEFQNFMRNAVLWTAIPNVVSPSITITADILNAGCTPAGGSIDITVSGGDAPYSFLWSNGATTEDVSGLAENTYGVLVVDNLGCYNLGIFDVIQATPPIVDIDTLQEIQCNGDVTGSLIANVTGGTAPFSYTWDSGQTTQTITGLGAGSYEVIVANAEGCEDTATAVLSEPAALTLALTQTQLISCFGGTNGIIQATAGGGTPPLTYSWDNGQTTATASGLSAGKHVLTITDANLCVIKDSLVLTEPPALTLTLSEAIPITCNGGNNGAVSGAAGGGTPPYSYLWGDGQMSQTAINLSAGWHYLQVTDQAGCTINDSLLLTEPTQVNAIINEIAGVICNGSATGALQASASQGTPPYDYMWDNGSPSRTINGLTAGVHTVIVTDVNNCADTLSYTITEPDSILISPFVSQEVSCNGASDGALSATVSGGTGAYTYLWSTGATTLTLSGVPAGSYSLQVTDANACVKSALVTLTEPNAIGISFPTVEDVSCNGGADGTAMAFVVGGTSPYTYLWNNGQTTTSAFGLSAGTAKVIVTDANSCVDSAEVVIQEPPLLTGGLAISQIISCNGFNDGAITATPSGGTAPYTYLWSDGQTTQTASNLTAGTYIVGITDSLSCIFVDSITITEPPALAASIVVSKVISCSGFSDGNLEATVLGGTAPYTYLWNTSATTPDITGVGQGLYSVTVTDSLNCAITANTFFAEPTPLLMSLVITDSIACFGDSTGSIRANVAGGTPGYNFLWNNGAMNDTLAGLGAGTYSVVVTDSLGCTLTDSSVVSQPTELLLVSSVLKNASCASFSDGEAEVSVSGGTAPYSYLWSNGDTTALAQGLGAGTHYITVTDSKNCVKMDSVILTEPDSLQLNIEVAQPITCFEGTDGILFANVQGGTVPYTYLWNNGQSTDSAFSLSADTFYVAVTDTNACIISDTLVLGQAPLLELSLSQIQAPNCDSANNGSALAIASGGLAPYSYSWDNGQTGPDLSNVLPGQYRTTVTDSLGCMLSDSLVVMDSIPWQAEVVIEDSITCFEGEDGSARVLVTGSGDTFTYLWSDGQNQDLAINLGIDSLSVLITDQYGCDTTLNLQMNQPAQMEVFASIILATPGENDGSIQVDSIRNGTAPYNFFWSSGDTDSLATGLGRGDYFLNLVDANGCEVRQEFAVDSTTFAWGDFQALPDFNIYQINLVWSTLREIGNEKFTIERSVDRLAFTPILERPSDGNSLSTQEYAIWDTEPIQGRSFYRIKQTSQNGYFTFFSEIREVYFGNEEPGYVIVFPVPVMRGDYVRVEFEMKSRKNTDVLIRNALHQDVYRTAVGLPEGRQSFELPTEGLSPGHYYILVGNGDETYTAQFIIQDP